MRTLVDTSNRRNITVSTDLQELRRQLKDKGITPAVSEIRKDSKGIQITGTSLLHRQGSFAASLSLRETSLLLMLQNQTVDELSFYIPLPAIGNGSDKDARQLSFNVLKMKKKVTTTHAHDTFRFDVKMKIVVDITGRNYETDLSRRVPELETQIAKVMQKDLEDLIKKCQALQIDPFGFGLYARAFQYQAWKPVQDHWEQAFATADVRFNTQVDIKSPGVVE